MQTTRYEYSRAVLAERIAYLTSLQAPYGLTVRYAVKANPYSEIIGIMNKAGISFDASSSYEATELLEQGIAGAHISLSSQQSPHNLPELLAANVLFVATSIKQLQLFLQTPGRPETVGVRINPDMEHGGHNNRTSTGGVNASFGIWHEYIPVLLTLTSVAGVTINRLHIHIGSGADPSIWGGVMDRSLKIAKLLPAVTKLDIGGGYKVHRYGDEVEADMVAVVDAFSQRLVDFARRTGRELALEIEPGTYLVAHAGTLVTAVDDIVDTGPRGHTFLRLTTGMNDFLRSALYGAQHKIEVINNARTRHEYVVVGHNCESGDIFSPAPNNPEEIVCRTLKRASIGDEVRIYDTGAYCASMRAKGYNSFPAAIEVMVD